MEGPRRLPWAGLECAVMGEAPGWVSGSTALLAAGAADWGRLDAAGGPVRCFVGVLGPTGCTTLLFKAALRRCWRHNQTAAIPATPANTAPATTTPTTIPKELSGPDWELVSVATSPRAAAACEWDAEAVDVATTAVPTKDGVLVGEALAAEVGEEEGKGLPLTPGAALAVAAAGLPTGEELALGDAAGSGELAGLAAMSPEGSRETYLGRIAVLMTTPLLPLGWALHPDSVSPLTWVSRKTTLVLPTNAAAAFTVLQWFVDEFGPHAA